MILLPGCHAQMELAVMRSELCALTEQCRTQQNQLAIQVITIEA